MIRKPCPKCGFTADAQLAECPACGIIFAKWQQLQEEAQLLAPRVALIIEDDVVTDGRIGKHELTILVGGLAAAIVVYALPFTRFVMSAMVTLFHEFGHAVVAWFLGHPALPAFDFVYGGGITHYGMFHLSIAIAIAAIFAWLGWTVRSNRRTLSIVVAVFAMWLVIITAEWRRDLVMASAGHVAEFVLAGILFYQALAGVGWRMPELERPLGAFVAFFVQIHSTMFALKLRNDAGFLAWYREGKGGALMNDLESIALDLHIRTPLNPGIEGVAFGLIVFSVVPIAVALLWYLNRASCHRAIGSLLLAESR